MAKHMMSKEKNVETYVGSIEPGKRALVQTLRRLVKAQAPHLVELMKWGNVCWVGAGNVCLIHVADDHLDFGFFMGASLPDPAGILVGNGKYLRMVKVRKAADIRPRALAGVIASAVSLDGGGTAPKRAKGSSVTEPTRQASRAIMSPKRAAHSRR